MRVLLVSGAFPPARLAEANHALHLAEALAAKGADVHVLTTVGATAQGYPFQVHASIPRWDWRHLPNLARGLRRLSPDAILLMYIGFAYENHPMVTFLPTLAKAILPGIPVVTQFENVMGASPDRFGAGARLARRLVSAWAGRRDLSWEFGSLLRDSDQVVALGHHHEAQLRDAFPPVASKASLIPPPPIIRMARDRNGTAREAGRAMLRLGPGDFVFTYFGYLYPSKGVETLFRAFQTVAAADARARLVVAGGIPDHLRDERLAYLKALESLASTLGLEGKIVWTGLLAWDDDRASLALSASDVCVLPFDLGISLNNSTFGAAAAHHLPVITTRGAVVEDVFRHGENVVLCPPKDPEALAGAMLALQQDPDLRGRLARGIETMAAEWFSWDRAAERILGLMRRPP